MGGLTDFNSSDWDYSRLFLHWLEPLPFINVYKCRHNNFWDFCQIYGSRLYFSIQRITKFPLISRYFLLFDDDVCYTYLEGF